MRHAGEPSVDEILESIKRVIARDNRQGAADERRRRETRGIPALEDAAADPAEEDDDVLDLAQAVRIADDADDEPYDLMDESEEAMERDAGRDAGPDGGDTGLVTPQAQASMRESLAALAMLAQPGAQPRIVRSGETSIEDLMREMLRPALSEWLEKNLPPIVEGMVAAEIRRIASKKS